MYLARRSHLGRGTWLIHRWGLTHVVSFALDLVRRSGLEES